MIINSWRIIISGNDYTAPELRRFRLQGFAGWLPDGENHLTTSPIVGSEEDGNVLITRSGNRYRLGEPEVGQKTFNELVNEYWYIPLK
jgi:hypothetical protein